MLDVLHPAAHRDPHPSAADIRADVRDRAAVAGALHDGMRSFAAAPLRV